MDEDEDSNTALHLACTNKRAKCVEILLNNGADVQSRNAKKWTPLDCAASVGAIHCAKLLLQVRKYILFGAQLQSHLMCPSSKAFKNKIGGPSAHSLMGSFFTVLRILNSLEISQIHYFMLLQYDSPIDPMDRNKTTPLHLAAQNGHNKMILLLLRAGADIAKEDAYGRNMLELAILSRKRYVIPPLENKTGH